MPDQVPSTIDTSGSDLTQVTPNTVRPSLKDRIMGTIAGTVNSATGGDPNAKTPLQTAIDKHHSQMADEANMHQRNYANYATGHLLTLQGINPETQQRFDDPTYKGPSQADMEAKYRNYRDSAHQMYLKSAGKTPELKKAIQTQGDLINHVGNAIATQQSPGNAAGNAARATAPAGGLQPPPGAGSSPAAPGTTSSSATGGAAISPSDEGNPGASGGLTPPPKSDAGPAAAATPPAPTPTTQAGVPPPPTPPANEPYDPMTAIAQNRLNKRAEAIAEESRQDKRKVAEYTAQQNVLKQNKIEEAEATAKARAKYGNGGAPPRPVPLPTPVTVLDARQLEKNFGQSYQDENGDDIDLAKIPDTMSLMGWRERIAEPQEDGTVKQGWVTRYRAVSPNQKDIIIGGEHYAINPGNVSKIPQGAGTDVGAAKVASTHTSTDPASGLTTVSTTTPKITGVPGRGATPPPPGSSNPGGGSVSSTPKTSKVASPASSTPIALDKDGNIPLDTPGYTSSVIEAANQLMNERDVDKIPAKVREVAAGLARRAGWEQGKFTPKEMTPIRLASDFLDRFAASNSLSVLDDNFLQRGKLIAALHDSTSLPGQLLTSAAARSLNPDQQEFVRNYNQVLSLVGGLSKIARGDKSTEAQVDRLKKELADAVTSASSVDARARLGRIQDEIKDAMTRGNFDHVGAGTAGATAAGARKTNPNVSPPPKSGGAAAASAPRRIVVP